MQSTFSPDKAVPGLIPLMLCAFFALYLVEDIQYAWAYEKQIMLYLLVWLTATVLACLWLVLRRHKWMLLPAGLMQLLCLTIPTLAARRVYSSISNRFMPYSTSLAEDMYTIFGQFSPQLLLIAILLAALYLVCCMIKIESSPE